MSELCMRRTEGPLEITGGPTESSFKLYIHTEWKLYEIVWSHVIHNFIGQINSTE